MTCLVAGIDPGRTGGLCFLHVGGPGAIYDMPLNDEGAVCFDSLVKLLIRYSPRVIVHEKLHGPNYFKLGEAYGTLCAACFTSRIRTETVAPRTWQAEILGKQIKDTKKAAIKYAAELTGPELLKRRPRGKPDDNRADSVCIAVYGVRHFTEGYHVSAW